MGLVSSGSGEETNYCFLLLAPFKLRLNEGMMGVVQKGLRQQMGLD